LKLTQVLVLLLLLLVLLQHSAINVCKSYNTLVLVNVRNTIIVVNISIN